MELLAHLDLLASQSAPGGGWGYAPDQPAHLEPTVLALLGLQRHADRYQATIDAARAWVEQQANDDGTYRLQRGRREAVWPTALVGFLHAASGTEGARLPRILSALLSIRGQQSEREDDDVNDIDGQLVGWPWAEGNFSWVEPTSWAILALRRAGHPDHPRAKEGLNLLLDRILAGGGLNYGNRRIFGISLEAIPGPSSLALLALQGMTDPRIQETVGYLCRESVTNGDLEHLCWMRLALDVHSTLPGASEAVALLGERIRASHRERGATPYLRTAPLRQALTTLALDVEHNPFRLPAEQAASGAVQAGKLASRKLSLTEWARSKVKGLAVTAIAQLKVHEPKAAVHIAPASSYNDDLVDILCRQYAHFKEKVPLAGKRVVLKPNLVEYHRDKVINTHPHVVAATIELCQREGAAEVIVAEGPGHWRNVEYLVAASGLGDVLRHQKVSFVDLNHDEPVEQTNLGRLTGLNNLYLSRTIATADVVISLPKLKTHHWAVATLSLKNLFGTLPGICYGWPKNELHWRGIDNSIVDIALTRTPDLAIVDGLVGMEGDGPLNGTPKTMGVLVMGADLVAVDATCCRLMQLDPEKVGYLVMGYRKKLGLLPAAQIEQLGETIASRAQPFATVEHFKGAWLGRGA